MVVYGRIIYIGYIWCVTYYIQFIYIYIYSTMAPKLDRIEIHD